MLIALCVVKYVTYTVIGRSADPCARKVLHATDTCFETGANGTGQRVHQRGVAIVGRTA